MIILAYILITVMNTEYRPRFCRNAHTIPHSNNLKIVYHALPVCNILIRFVYYSYRVVTDSVLIDYFYFILLISKYLDSKIYL